MPFPQGEGIETINLAILTPKSTGSIRIIKTKIKQQNKPQSTTKDPHGQTSCPQDDGRERRSSRSLSLPQDDKGASTTIMSL